MSNMEDKLQKYKDEAAPQLVNNLKLVIDNRDARYVANQEKGIAAVTSVA